MLHEEAIRVPPPVEPDHQLDDGGPISIRGRHGPRELELRVDIKCCARIGCDCTNVYLEISRGDRPGSAHVVYDAASGAMARLREPAKRPPPGHNEPCWCGSGKKYKRCRLGSEG